MTSAHEFSVANIAKYINATIKGDATCIITSIAPLECAKVGQISFLDNPKYRKFLASTDASAVILSDKFANECTTTALVTDNPYLAYAKVANLFNHAPKLATSIHPTVVRGHNCHIGDSVAIGANVVIGDHVSIGENAVIGANTYIGPHTIIGANTIIHPNVSIGHDTKIGARVTIFSGVVIGADGFGYARTESGWHKVAQLGRVIIGDDVDIGANTTIDRGALEDTVLANGVKLDNQIQIGHNVQIGENTAIAGCVGIAGSVTIGKNCMIGGGACISGHLSICDQTIITGMTGISRSITKPGIYSAGIPAENNERWRKNASQFRHLADMRKKIKKLERLLES